MAPTFMGARVAGSGIATGNGMSMVRETREGVSDGTPRFKWKTAVKD